MKVTQAWKKILKLLKIIQKAISFSTKTLRKKKNLIEMDRTSIRSFIKMRKRLIKDPEWYIYKHILLTF